jgi:hypothetical protein
MTDPWSRLGIARTQDETVIRRAYAALVKQTRPDVDPAGFRELRAAFEAAQDWARQSAGPAPVEILPIEPLSPVPALGMVPILFLGSARDRVAAAIEAGRLIEAAEAWRAGIESAEIGFQDEEMLALALARQALALAEIDAETLARLIGIMGWAAAGHVYRTPRIIRRVLARREALAWFAELRRCATERDGWWPWKSPLQSAAQLLLKPAPGPLSRRFPYLAGSGELKYWLRDWERHQRFLADRFDPERLAWCQKALRRPDLRIPRQAWEMLACLVAIALAVAVIIVGIGLLGSIGHPLPGQGG